MESVEIIDTNIHNIMEYGICGYKNMKHEELRRKLEWLKNRFPEGLKIKTLYSATDGTQGMVEYIPGDYCWRPVEADGYMFIHCIFVGFKRAYKAKGYASRLLDECQNDAKSEKMYGVAAVTRKGSFMAGKELFVKHGFEIVDKAPPDFELLVKKFDSNTRAPKFKREWEKRLGHYSRGLTIIRADQCPYSVKNVKEIVDTAERDYGLKTTIKNQKNCREAQNSPCAFGTFCIVYNGKVIACHPISSRRFSNIMNKVLH
jgi:hypothetical protein